MTDPAPTPDETVARWLVVVAVVGIALLVLCTISPSAVEQLLIGWLYFPARVLPRVTVDRPTLILGTACVCATFVLMHSLLGWYVRARSGDPTRRWSIRSTAVVTSLFLLMFVAGTAMVGATHQAVWVITGATSRGKASEQTAPVFGAVQQSRNSAAQWRFRNNLRQVGIAAGSFEANNHAFPYGGAIDEHGTQLHGWIVLVSPYLIYSYADIDMSQPWNSPANQQYFQCAVPEVLHPSIPAIFDDHGYGLSHVAGNVYVMPVITVSRGQSVDVWDLNREDQGASPLVSADDMSDGAAHTILAGEVVTHFQPWGSPGNLRDPSLGVNRSRNGFGCLPHEPGAQFVMCDGSVRSISPDVDASVMRALATPAGDERGADDF